jgi:hypothetical protein
MSHLGDTNKMVMDTPRTDARRGFHGWYTAVDAEFSEKLERELNAANQRIKRLEEAGDALAYNHNPFTFIDWTKAKEAKL